MPRRICARGRLGAAGFSQELGDLPPTAYLT